MSAAVDQLQHVSHTAITCIGPKALTIHNGLPFQSEDEKENLAKILDYVNPREDKGDREGILRTHPIP